MKRRLSPLRRLYRFERIMLALLRHDVGHLLIDSGIARHLNWYQRTLLRMLPYRKPSPQRLIVLIESLGPTFVKFGQMLSVRPDLVAPAYITSLESLQSNTFALDSVVIISQIEHYLGQPIDAVFKSFDPTPIASASIAQVHRAQLHDGTPVAIKVRRPGITHQFELDIDLMYTVAELIQRYTTTSHLVSIVKEFDRSCQQELDFTCEASYLKQFRSYYTSKQYVKDTSLPRVIVPRVYEHLSSQGLIVMDYIQGTPFTDIGNQPPDVAHKVMTDTCVMIFDQVFSFGYFHADPHPGNIIVTPQGSLGLIDFGIVGVFDATLQAWMRNLVWKALINDVDGIVDLLYEYDMADTSRSDKSQLYSMLRTALKEIHHDSVTDIRLGYLIDKLFNTINANHIKIPIQCILFARLLIVTDGITRQYDPSFNLTATIIPYMERLIKKDIRKRLSMKQVGKTVSRSANALLDIPQQTSMLLNKLARGALSINIQDTDIKRLAIEIDRSSNRVSFAVIIAALIMSGSLLLTVGEFVINPLAVVAFSLFIIAGFVGLALLISIRNETRQ